MYLSEDSGHSNGSGSCSCACEEKYTDWGSENWKSYDWVKTEYMEKGKYILSWCEERGTDWGNKVLKIMCLSEGSGQNVNTYMEVEST